MKATDLMIGDWVMYRNSPKKVVYINDRPLRELHNNEIEFTHIGFTHNDSEWIAAHNATPIPLTEDILKVNGFEKDKHMSDYYLKYGDMWVVLIGKYMWLEYRTKKCFGCVEAKVRMPKDFSCVHELQHALRLCGLRELADNFKV